MFAAPLARITLVERPVGEGGKLAALVACGVSHSTVWRICSAVALDGDLVLAAEGALAAGAHRAAHAAVQQQRTELVALREAVLALEQARVAAGGTYASMKTEARATIKCIFKLKELTGFSKILS